GLPVVGQRDDEVATRSLMLATDTQASARRSKVRGNGGAGTGKSNGRGRVAGVAANRDSSSDVSRCGRREGHIQCGGLPRRQRGVGAYSTRAVTGARSSDARNGYIGIAVVGQRHAEGAAIAQVHTAETQTARSRTQLRGDSGTRTGKSNGRGRVASIAGHRHTASEVACR